MVAHVLEGGLNLRQNPGTYSNIIMELSEGTGLTIKNFSGDWYYVEFEETLEDGTANIIDGYVHKDYVKISSAKQASNLLKLGMSGAEVRNVQQQLRERNFMPCPGDGLFR